MQSLRRFAVTAILTTSAPVARIAWARVRQIGRHAVEVVGRQHDPAAAGLRVTRSSKPARHSTSTYSAPRASASREEPTALFFRAVERAAFPGRPAGDDHRQPPAGERAGDVRVADRVEPQLDEVGVAHGVALAAQFRRRGAVTVTQRWTSSIRGSGPSARTTVAQSKKKPLQPVG